ncbi:MAG: hypothetical protein LUC16_03665 [Coprobacillus sp.]|nr:hypothetical protein [Coprobacillus sp.]
MKRKTVIIITIINLVVVVLLGVIPPVIFSANGLLKDLDTYLNVEYWVGYAVGLVFLIGFSFFCVNHQTITGKKLFITTEIFALLMQLMQFISIFFSYSSYDKNYILVLVIDLALIIIWGIFYAMLNTKQIRRRYQ